MSNPVLFFDDGKSYERRSLNRLGSTAQDQPTNETAIKTKRIFAV